MSDEKFNDSPRCKVCDTTVVGTNYTNIGILYSCYMCDRLLLNDMDVIFEKDRIFIVEYLIDRYEFSQRHKRL